VAGGLVPPLPRIVKSFHSEGVGTAHYSAGRDCTLFSSLHPVDGEPATATAASFNIQCNSHERN
jgi:hypothetical protein